jgi:transcriptional regulator with XRE-family HTH domain
MMWINSGGFMSSAEAVRTYIITLRTRQRISQEVVADAVGLTRRAYIMWETGETKDIKLPILMRALRAVGGWVEHLNQISEASEDEAKAVADAWLELSAVERKALRTMFSSDDGRSQVLRSVAELTDDPEVQTRLRGYLDRLQEERGQRGET